AGILLAHMRARLGGERTPRPKSGQHRQHPTKAIADGPRPDPAAVTRSYEECHRVARAANSNFVYAFLLLPKPKRDALTALYAFNRLVDDVSDEGIDLAARQRGLARWRTALDQAITGQEQVFDGNAAVISPADGLVGAEILPALADTV